MTVIAVVSTIFGHISVGRGGCFAWWGEEVSLEGFVKYAGVGYCEWGVSGETWLAGFTWTGIGARLRLWGGIGYGVGIGVGIGVGGVGGIVIAEFGVKGLHFFHAHVVSDTQLEFVHGSGWVKVDVVSEGSGLQGEGHALEYHFLVKVWCAEGCFAEAVDECSERFIRLLSDAQ